jgi:excinuclease ABC subunit C
MHKPTPSEIPDAPGSYQFRDRHGEVVYVGKAKSLRKRVSSYFIKAHAQAPRTRDLMAVADTVEWIVTETEVEALLLEYSLIQRHRPRFNIRLRDDKSYPFLALTRSDQWPAARVVRGRRRAGTQYFGPFAHAYAVRNTLDLLLKTYPVRTCSDGKFATHVSRGRPCLLFDIGKCSGPCIGAVAPADYDLMLDGLAAFFSGDGTEVVADLRSRMAAASDALEFERAARHRDQIADVERALSRQEVASAGDDDFDVIAVHEDDLEASVQVLVVRKGRLVGGYGSIVEKVEELDAAGITGRVVVARYQGERPPREVLVEHLPDDADLLERWLSDVRGSAVDMRVPQRGSKRRLLETAHTNAKEAFTRHRLRHSADPNQRAQSLRSLQEVLALPSPPLRIECFDVSTLQGRNTVASMVVLEDGLPKRSQYRRFRIKGVPGQDDFASMEEALDRRFTAYLAERDRPAEDRGRFAYPPSLVIVDGGAGQLGRAVAVLARLGLDIPVVGLAKRLEEVYRPGAEEPLRIPRGEPALHLLQRARDEAHRFAVSYHRTLRAKSMVDSVLDDVPGVGASRKQALVRRFGSLKRIRAADLDELAEVVPRGVAESLYAALHQPTPQDRR